jgi:hypothetical protein
MLDFTPHEPLPGYNPRRHGTSPHERLEPVLRLHCALRPRRALGGEHYVTGDPLRGHRTRSGNLRGRACLSAAAPEKGRGFLDLGSRRTPRARPHPPRCVRRPSRRSSSSRSSRRPLADDALDGPRDSYGRRRDLCLEGQRPLDRRWPRHCGWPPRPRTFGTRLRSRPTGRTLVACRIRGAHPVAGPCRGGSRRGLRAPVSGIEKARRKRAFRSDPTGIRTPVFAVRGRCPRPLDDGAAKVDRVQSLNHGSGFVKGPGRGAYPRSSPPFLLRKNKNYLLVRNSAICAYRRREG